MICWRISRRARFEKFCRVIVVIWKKRFSLKNETKSMNDDESDVSKVLKMIAAIEWLSIRIILRVNYCCVEISFVSKIETETKIKTKTRIETKTETETETKTEIRLWVRSNTLTTSDSENLWFEMLRFVMLTTLMNESRSRWFDWSETCLFTNNAFFCSKCVVSKFKKIRNSIDSSWIFALLILTVSIRVIWVRFVSLTTFLFKARWVFVNVRSSLKENMTINLRLSFAINEINCVMTLMRMII